MTETVLCSFTTFIPSYCKQREEHANDDRYGVHREDYYLKQKFHDFSAEVDKEVTRKIMELLPAMRDQFKDQFPECIDPTAAFVLYDATGGYSNRTMSAWGNSGYLQNIIHASIDQVPMHFMTENGHQACSQYGCDGFISLDGWLAHRFFPLNGLQPSLQAEKIANFLNFHTTCTHACITLRNIDDFHSSVRGYQLAFFQQLPDGAVMHAGHGSFVKEKFFKYILIRDQVVETMQLCKSSPVSPPVPKRRRPASDSDSDNEDTDDDEMHPRT